MFGLELPEELFDAIPSVAQSYRELVSRLRDLPFDSMYGASESGRRGLRDVQSLVRSQFAAEEKQMRDAKYPLLEAHLREHTTIVKLVDEICAAVEQASTIERDVLAITNQLLANLIAQHTQQADKELCDSLGRQAVGGRRRSVGSRLRPRSGIRRGGDESQARRRVVKRRGKTPEGASER